MPDLPIIFRDDALVAIDKPAGLLVHASDIDRHEKHNAMSLLRDQLGQWVYPVHRLDKATSGVLLFATSSELARELSLQFETHRVEKNYVAMVRGWAGIQREQTPLCEDSALVASTLTEVFAGWGAQNAAMRLRRLRPDENSWRLVDKPLAKPRSYWSRRERSRQQKLRAETAASSMPEQISSDKKPAQTHYRAHWLIELDHAVDRYPSARYSVLEVKPLTGRPHQIRRHLKSEGYPIVGDRKYGKATHNNFFADGFGENRLMLAAQSLTVEHPLSRERLTIRRAPSEPWAYFFSTNPAL